MSASVQSMSDFLHLYAEFTKHLPSDSFLDLPEYDSDPIPSVRNPRRVTQTLLVQHQPERPDLVTTLILGCGQQMCHGVYAPSYKCHLSRTEGVPHTGPTVVSVDIDYKASPNIIHQIEGDDMSLVDFLRNESYINIVRIICCGLYIPNTFQMMQHIFSINPNSHGTIYIYGGTLFEVIGEEKNGQPIIGEVEIINEQNERYVIPMAYKYDVEIEEYVDMLDVRWAGTRTMEKDADEWAQEETAHDADAGIRYICVN